MAALIYLLLSLSLCISLRSVCAGTLANFSAAEDYDFDEDRRTDLLAFYSSMCRAMKTSYQINQVPCPGQPAEHFEIGKRYMKLNNTDDALHIRLLMPGLGKEDVEVYVDENELIVEGKKEMDFEKGSFLPRFVLHLPMGFLKANEITAEMKNGVLKLRVPKTKQQQQMFGIVVYVNVE